MSAENSKGEAEQNAQHNPAKPVQESTSAEAPPTGKEQNNSPILRILKDPQWWQAFAATVLVPVGAYALWIYSGQLDEMRRSTNAAFKAVRTAHDSLEFARENAVRDQRPWVTLTTAVCSKPLTANERIEATCQFSNSGRSPALAEIRYRFFFGDSELNKEVEWDENDKPESVALITPNLGYPAPATSDLVLTQDQIELARSKVKWLFLKVVIRYKDTVGNSYVTKVCMKCGGQAVDNGHLLACGSGQEAQ